VSDLVFNERWPGKADSVDVANGTLYVYRDAVIFSPEHQRFVEVVVVERAEPDERMPVRYRLAKVVVSVVFNTVPSP
jgi:hypothetical protein